jgi:hypothetical protein
MAFAFSESFGPVLQALARDLIQSLAGVIVEAIAGGHSVPWGHGDAGGGRSGGTSKPWRGWTDRQAQPACPRSPSSPTEP